MKLFSILGPSFFFAGWIFFLLPRITLTFEQMNRSILGLLSPLIIMIVRELLRFVPDNDYSAALIYLDSLYYDYVLFLFAFAVYFLIEWRQPYRPLKFSLINALFFFCGYYPAFALLEWILGGNPLTAYYLFYLPFLRISAGFGILLLFYLVSAFRWPLKTAFILSLILLPFVMSLDALMFRTNRPIPGLILLVFLLSGSLAGILLFRRKRSSLILYKPA